MSWGFLFLIVESDSWGCLGRFLDQFDFVVVWVGYEGDYGGIVFYWFGFVGDLVVVVVDVVVGLVGVVDFDGDMVVVGVDFVGIYVLVVGKFDYCGICFVVIVDEGEGELVVGIVVFFEQGYVQYLGIEID